MKKILLAIIPLILVIIGCGSVPTASNVAPTTSSRANTAPAATGADELDAAIRETSDYLNKQLPKGNKLVILNIQSEFPALSEYIIDELIANGG